MDEIVKEAMLEALHFYGVFDSVGVLERIEHNIINAHCRIFTRSQIENAVKDAFAEFKDAFDELRRNRG